MVTKGGYSQLMVVDVDVKMLVASASTATQCVKAERLVVRNVGQGAWIDAVNSDSD